jgi:hypothetical protein
MASILISGAFFLLMAGMTNFASWALLLGVIGFGLTVVFQLINLPVEFNASSRAKDELINLRIISASELPYINKVLTAAAMTYVAATVTSVMNLVYYALQYAMVSDRDG